MILEGSRGRVRGLWLAQGPGTGSHSRGATLVEFALVAPLFFAALFGLFSVALYIFEVQVANQSAQAAARWGVAQCNFSSTCSPSASVPQCPAGPAPAGMEAAAAAAAGPFAGSLAITDQGGTGPTYAGGAYYCQITVTIPFGAAAGLFGLAPQDVSATAVDYVT